MKGILYSLVNDLQNKAQILIGLIENSSHHPEIPVEYVTQATERLKHIADGLEQMSNDKYLLDPIIIKDNFRQYRAISEEVQLIESYPVQAILRYNDFDHYFNQLLCQICQQIGYPLMPPLISTMSSEYYWAFTKYNLIALPIGEALQLLNLPDLFHEIGHFLFMSYAQFLVGNFGEDLQKYIGSEKQRSLKKKASYFIDLFDDLEVQWRDKWVVEFVCDMIATFLVGPAYGWANLKLSFNSSTKFEVYGPGATGLAVVEHPSDEARMRGIYSMLQLLGQEEQITALDREWQYFLDFAGFNKPVDYDYFYPQNLISTLAEYVCEGAKNVGLISYPNQLKAKGKTFAEILNEAWDKILSQPNDYADFEKRTLEVLRAFFDKQGSS